MSLKRAGHRACAELSRAALHRHFHFLAPEATLGKAAPVTLLCAPLRCASAFPPNTPATPLAAAAGAAAPPALAAPATAALPQGVLPLLPGAAAVPLSPLALELLAGPPVPLLGACGGSVPLFARALHTATSAAKEGGEDMLRSASSAAAPGASASQPQQQEQQQQEPGEERRGGSYWRLKSSKVFREDGTEWPWHCFTPADTYRSDTSIEVDKHFKPGNWGDIFAKYLVKSLRIPTDVFFQRRYGCRAMMLETVAAVPGMVAGMLLHLKSLRLLEHSGGWIKALLDEAENERMHLMTFMEVAKPRWYERALIFSVQAVFFTAYTAAYAVSPRIAHRIVGYLEEEAVHSYTEFLRDIDAGKIENVPAPQIAIDYWRLPKDATLRDVVVVVRADEAHHRDVNHFAANVVQEGKNLKDHPAPVDYH